MKDTNVRHFASICMILLMIGSFTILFTGSDNYLSAEPERDNETKITWGWGRQWDPSIFNDKVTWMDGTGGIFVYDIETEEVRDFTRTTKASSMDIYGRNLVYQDHQGTYENYDIFLMDIETGTSTMMIDGDNYQRDPRIWGDLVTWTEKDRGYTKIAYVHLPSTNYAFFSYSESNQTNPDVFGRVLVYQDDTNGNWDIRYYDVFEREEVEIVTDSSEQRYPKIWGDNVVWADNRNGNWDIYHYDLMTGVERQLTTDYDNQTFPSIYENMVVWMDDRNGNWDIFMMDINEGIPVQVTMNLSSQIKPDIYDDVIVWEDHRLEATETYQSYSIFMTNIDQDDDGIYDWDDPQPTIPHIDMQSIDGKLDLIISQMASMETNLNNRLDELETDLIGNLDGMEEDLEIAISEGIDEVLFNLNDLGLDIWMFNDSIQLELLSIKENLTTINETLISDYLGVLEGMISDIRDYLEGAIFEMISGIETGMDNSTSDLEGIQESMEELDRLEEIITELEDLSRDVEDIGDDDDETGYTVLDIFMITMLVMIVILLLFNLFRNRKPERDLDYSAED